MELEKEGAGLVPNQIGLQALSLALSVYVGCGRKF